MKIKKIGHSCLVIEEGSLRILTDPGSFTVEENIRLKDIDIVLLTHEHVDHFHIDSLKKIIENNPRVKIITNTAVGKLLDKEGIKYEIVLHGQSKTVGEVLFEGFGEWHAVIYPSLPVVPNTGYFINNKLFYPGDAFYNPRKAVQVLALPVGGPWVKLSEAIDYAKEIHPKDVFPVHDGMFKSPGAFFFLQEKIFSEAGIKFIGLEEGGEIDI